MKSSLDDLALFGGRPAFTEKLHVGRPNIGDRARLLERVSDILDRRWLTNAGPYVEEFESRIAELVPRLLVISFPPPSTRGHFPLLFYCPARPDSMRQ